MSRVSGRWIVLFAAATIAVAGLSCSATDAQQPAEAQQPADARYNRPAAPVLEDLELKDSVSRNGITWTFAAPARVGQFVTGEWYVVGPVTVKAINPKPLAGEEVLGGEWTRTPKLGADGKVVKDVEGDTVYEVVDVDATEKKEFEGKYCRNGSVLNVPPLMSKCGFDSRMRHEIYNPELNARPPIEMKPGDALVSTISKEKMRRRTHFSPVQAVAVLTCLKEPVASDAFRPGYMDREQAVYFARSLRRDLLPKLAPVGKVPEVQPLVNRFAEPWMAHSLFKEDHAPYQHAGYGQSVCVSVGNAALLLCLDLPADTKEPLLRNLVQRGIDFWSIVKSGHPGFPAWGGWNSGYKFPIVMAGRLLGDEVMASPSTAFPKCAFHEDEQTAYGPCWTGAKVVFSGHSGIDAATGKGRDKTRGRHLWGPYEHLHPSLRQKDQRQSESYRRCCTSRAWLGQALAARLMGLEKDWAHDAFFDYCDRWVYEDETEIQKVYAEVRGQPWPEWAHQGQFQDTWVQAMWKAYRKTVDAPIDGWTKEKKNAGGMVLPPVQMTRPPQEDAG